MKKRLVSILIVIIITVIASSFTSIAPDVFFISSLYTVAGIMFSIGLGLISTFNLSGIKNKIYILKIRKNINHVRNNFLIYFAISTGCYILNQYIEPIKAVSFKISFLNIYIHFQFSILFCILLIYCTIYFIVNFLEIQKLNNDIFDRMNEEEAKK